MVTTSSGVFGGSPEPENVKKEETPVPKAVQKDGITISKDEYLELKRSSDKLSALEDWGVDNWGGYDIAMTESGFYEKWG